MEKLDTNKQIKSYKGQNLPNANFKDVDLRGVDFSGASLNNADFTNCRTGLRKISIIIIFLFSLILSLVSGYVAMLAGSTVQLMIKSSDSNIITSGYITIILMVFFILFAIWKGGKATLIPIAIAISIILLTGLMGVITKTGSGMGSIYSSLALILFVLMFFAGTISRATAGTLASNIIFLIVALGGGMFGKSLGGGLGTVVMAVACAIISKRALSAKSEGFTTLKKYALKIGSFYGTSFRNADLTSANFSNSEIKNTDFEGASLAGINWKDAKIKFSIIENLPEHHTEKSIEHSANV